LVEHALLDHLIGSDQHPVRNREPKRPGRLEVDGKLELRRLLYRKVGRFGTLEDLDVISKLASCQPELGWLLRDGGKPL